MNSYIGIGDEDINTNRVYEIVSLSKLFDNNWYLRTTGEYGTAAAFEKACVVTNEIYLPWSGYNGHDSNFDRPTHAALTEASKYRTDWREMSDPAKAKAARLTQVILGYGCNHPCSVIIHSSQNYNMKFIRKIAKKYNIKMINLSKTTHLSDIKKIVDNIC